jgi:hypothetical protein
LAGIAGARAFLVLTYLFDASAAVELYAPRNARREKIVRFIVEQKWPLKKAILYIPNFCVVEVFNTLARKCFRDSMLDKTQYESALNRFRNDIHWGRTLYSYELTRYHVIGADEIIPIEHHVASEHERDHLSTFEILIIAMASELAYVGEPENTRLVTCDRRIPKVVEEFKGVSLRDRTEWKVEGGLDDHSVRRWVPSNVIYLPDLRRDDWAPVPGQAPLSL